MMHGSEYFRIRSESRSVTKKLFGEERSAIFCPCKMKMSDADRNGNAEAPPDFVRSYSWTYAVTLRTVGIL